MSSFTPRTCQLDWYNTMEMAKTSNIKDIKGNCTVGDAPGCYFPNDSTNGFNSSLQYRCSNDLENNPAALRAKDKTGYVCACGTTKLLPANKDYSEDCRGPSCHPVNDRYRCGLIHLDNPRGRIEMPGPRGYQSIVTGAECVTMLCGSITTGLFSKANSTFCTDEKRTQPYLCNGLYNYSWLNDSQTYLCNCQGIPDIDDFHAVNPGIRDVCKDNYGVIEKASTSVSSSGASESGSVSPTSTGAGAASSQSSTNASAIGIKLSLKSAIGWATFSLFILGLTV